MDTPFISMRKISKRYTGVQALDNVNFEVRHGEVLCLAGTNGSGKSTLIKIISGVEQPDEGAEIFIDGKESRHRSSISSIHEGIEVIYQDLSLFPSLSVAENIALSRIVSGRKKLLRKKQYRQIAGKAMKRIGVNIPMDKEVGTLSIADQQLVAICRALTSDLQLLILDEPTTALTRKEVAALFKVIEELKQKGIATLFVSHKLDEVMQIAERVTILRDGILIGTFAASDLDSKKIEYHMTGANYEYAPVERNISINKPLLEVSGLSKKGNFKDISFNLYPGEILGITGLLGSGRTELALSLFGMNPQDSGTIKLNGKEYRFTSVSRAVEAGIAYVPENRLVQGLVMPQSVAKNSVITIIERLLNKWRIIDEAKKNNKIDELIESFNIKVPSPDAPVSTLSGGNQQKIVLAKWVAVNPRLLILDGPTVGIDVAAKGSIHAAIRELASKGLGVIIISDEIPEVLNSSHRVLVMNSGRITAELNTENLTESDIAAKMENTGEGA